MKFSVKPERKLRLAFFLAFACPAAYLCIAVRKKCITNCRAQDCMRKHQAPYRRWAIYMINYSTFMQVNPANRDEAPKAHARAQVNEVMTLRDFTKHIADHGGYSRGKVNGVISDMCACLVEMLLEGKKVQLGDLGDFWITLNSKGADSCQAFTAGMITGINVVFSPGKDFEGMLGKATFAPVASRAAQAATLKAEKTGEKTVDLEAAKKKGDSDKADSGNGSGDNQGGDSMQ